MKFYLIVAKGSKVGLPIPIHIDLFLIGSEKMCQLRARSLGAKHCAFVTRDKKVFVRDFNSGQPTLVNGTVVAPNTECPLHAGDRIAIGPLEFMIQLREKPLSQRDLEEWAAHCLDEQVHRNVLDEEEETHKAANAAEAASQLINKLNVMKGMVKGRLRIGRERGVVTVRFNDTILVEEAEISHIKHELCENLNRPNLRVLLDLKNIRRLSSNSVTMLNEFHRWLAPFGSSMAICRVRRSLREAVGSFLDSSIPVFPDKPSAIAARW